MKSVVIPSPGTVNIQDTKEGICEENQVKIKVTSVGICGSDIAAYLGKSPLCTYPRIIGHEIVGIIAGVNNKSNGLKEGERVIVKPYISCNSCYACSIGRTNCCRDLKVLGVHVDGGISEYFCHPADLTYRLPDSVPDEEAPLIEPLSVSLHAVNRLKIKEGEHVVVMGAGAIGNFAAQLALSRRAVPIMVDLLEKRCEIAKALGIEYVINPGKQDIMEEVKKITAGRMAECVIDATGAAQAIRNTFDAVSHAGRIALIGWPDKEVLLPTKIITLKELDVFGSRVNTTEFAEAIDMAAQKCINLKALISKVVPFGKIPESIVDIANNPGDYMKVTGMIE